MRALTWDFCTQEALNRVLLFHLSVPTPPCPLTRMQGTWAFSFPVWSWAASRTVPQASRETGLLCTQGSSKYPTEGRPSTLLARPPSHYKHQKCWIGHNKDKFKCKGEAEEAKKGREARKRCGEC